VIVGLWLTTFARFNRAAYQLYERALLTREVLEAASSKLIEAALLMLVAGEDHLAIEVEEITEQMDSTALVPPLERLVYPLLNPPINAPETQRA
jgi:hypothetical protein